MKEGKGKYSSYSNSGNLSRSNVKYQLIYLKLYISSLHEESDLKLIESMKKEKNLDMVTMDKNLEKINTWYYIFFILLFVIYNFYFLF